MNDMKLLVVIAGTTLVAWGFVDTIENLRRGSHNRAMINYKGTKSSEEPLGTLTRPVAITNQFLHEKGTNRASAAPTNILCASGSPVAGSTHLNIEQTNVGEKLLSAKISP